MVLLRAGMTRRKSDQQPTTEGIVRFGERLEARLTTMIGAKRSRGSSFCAAVGQSKSLDAETVYAKRGAENWPQNGPNFEPCLRLSVRFAATKAAELRHFSRNLWERMQRRSWLEVRPVSGRLFSTPISLFYPQLTGKSAHIWLRLVPRSLSQPSFPPFPRRIPCE